MQKTECGVREIREMREMREIRQPREIQHTPNGSGLKLARFTGDTRDTGDMETRGKCYEWVKCQATAPNPRKTNKKERKRKQENYGKAGP